MRLRRPQTSDEPSVLDVSPSRVRTMAGNTPPWRRTPGPSLSSKVKETVNSQPIGIRPANRPLLQVVMRVQEELRRADRRGRRRLLGRRLKIPQSRDQRVRPTRLKPRPCSAVSRTCSLETRHSRRATPDARTLSGSRVANVRATRSGPPEVGATERPSSSFGSSARSNSECRIAVRLYPAPASVRCRRESRATARRRRRCWSKWVGRRAPLRTSSTLSRR
jgi:hypothetical protein